MESNDWFHADISKQEAAEKLAKGLSLFSGLLCLNSVLCSSGHVQTCSLISYGLSNKEHGYLIRLIK